MFTITRNGLEAIQKDLGVISNNIANANTNGFKIVSVTQEASGLDVVSDDVFLRTPLTIKIYS